MKEVVDRILQTEKEAKKIIKEGKQKAADIQRKTDEKINREKTEVKEENRSTINKEVEKAKKEIRELKTEPLPENQEDLLHELGIHPDTFEKITKRVKKILIKPDIPVKTD